MANKRRYYENGSAAYDMYSNAVSPLHLPQELPEERAVPARKQKVKVKAKAAIAPFALVGVVVALCLLTMVVYGFVQLYEASSEVGELNGRLTELQIENGKLRSGYESAIDLTLIELQAKQLGMKMPSPNQEVYLNISNTDRGEVIAAEKPNVFRQTWEAVRESFTGILEYFS